MRRHRDPIISPSGSRWISERDCSRARSTTLVSTTERVSAVPLYSPVGRRRIESLYSGYGGHSARIERLSTSGASV